MTLVHVFDSMRLLCLSKFFHALHPTLTLFLSVIYDENMHFGKNTKINKQINVTRKLAGKSINEI